MKEKDVSEETFFVRININLRLNGLSLDSMVVIGNLYNQISSFLKMLMSLPGSYKVSIDGISVNVNSENCFNSGVMLAVNDEDGEDDEEEITDDDDDEEEETYYSEDDDE